MQRASSVDFLKICAEHVLFISVVIPKHELARRGKNRNPGLFSFYKCFNSTYNLDVLLTKHSLQLLFPAFRLRDPKLNHILLMCAS